MIEEITERFLDADMNKKIQNNPLAMLYRADVGYLLSQLSNKHPSDHATTCAVCYRPMEDKGAAEHWCSDECYAKRARPSVDNGVIKALETA